METMKAIAKRKSTRSYKQDQIPNDILNTILAAGCAAPVNLGNYDTLHLTVIQDKEILKKLSASVSKVIPVEGDLLYGAPTIVLISSLTDETLPDFDYVNTGCVLENMMIAATDQKVDSVLIGGTVLALNADLELQKAFEIPDGFKAMASVALGYAATPDQTEKELTVKIAMNRV
ncbi:MAG: nitroreductase family protein [Oscillospiraceae bacterium]